MEEPDFKETKIGETITDVVRFERLRTLLCFSKLKNKKIWLVLRKDGETNDAARIVSGIVDDIKRGAEELSHQTYKTYMGGRVSFVREDGRISNEYFDLNEILHVSYEPIRYEPKHVVGDRTFSTFLGENILERYGTLNVTGSADWDDLRGMGYCCVLADCPDVMDGMSFPPKTRPAGI